MVLLYFIVKIISTLILNKYIFIFSLFLCKFFVDLK